MNSPLRILLSQSHDPWFNLAVEESIFQQMPVEQKVLFLWRNDNTVVIGRAQNPWKECNTRKMAADGIKLARRSSGGGAVFHDLGNTCFTFMAGKADYDKSISTQIILTALMSLGLTATASGRNDLVIRNADGEKKISGSAYKETSDRGFHHGTLLINANLNQLANYLNPDIKKLQAKGIRSVRARVANITEYLPNIDHDMVCQAIIKAFTHYYGQSATIELLAPNPLPDLPGLCEIFAKQRSWQWNYGHAPAFSHVLDERFSWGGVELQFDVEQGHITDCQIFTDTLDPAPLEYLKARMIGCPYQPQAIKQCVLTLHGDFPEHQQLISDVSDWLQHALD